MNANYILLCLLFAFAKAYSQDISLQTENTDIQEIRAEIALDFESESITGEVEVKFLMLRDTTHVTLDAKNMKLLDYQAHDQIRIAATNDKIIFEGNFNAGKVYTTRFSYSATPSQAAYFVRRDTTMQFWTQGQGKYTSHWLPSIDDMNDKILFSLTVSAPEEKSIISIGTAEDGLKKNGIVTQRYSLSKPISSYLVALVVGNYKDKSQPSSTGVPLEYYYYPEDSLKVNPTYKHSKRIFDFLESTIGVSFPFSNYRQVPVKDFLYAGMENASCTLFSDHFMVDAVGYADRNYVNVNAHELAHQWFGDMVTEVKSEHHWLHEGFATYYALLAEREIFGDDYFYFKLFETAERLRELSDTGKGQRLVAAGGSSLTYYQKGAWALHILKEQVGEDAFAKAVQNYLNKYAYQNVTTSNFIDEVKAVSGQSLEDFENNWLYQSAFQAEEALASLKESPFMRSYFELQSLRSTPLSSKYNDLMDAVTSKNDYLGQEAIYQLSEESVKAVLPIYKKALESNATYIRQAVAVSIPQVSEPLVNNFYELLKDPSYVTQEQALIKLWTFYGQRNNMEGQKKVLDMMSGSFGFTDGNLKTLWLALSLATEGYYPKKSLDRYKELISYTAHSNPYQLRENAFRYLFQLHAFEKESLRNLIKACVHHVWRFRKNSRQTLEAVLEGAKSKQILNEILPSLSSKERAYIASIQEER